MWLSALPSATSRSSSVNLPQRVFNLPRSCFHCPLILSWFIVLLLVCCSSVRRVRSLDAAALKQTFLQFTFEFVYLQESFATIDAVTMLQAFGEIFRAAASAAHVLVGQLAPTPPQPVRNVLPLFHDPVVAETSRSGRQLLHHPVSVHCGLLQAHRLRRKLRHGDATGRRTQNTAPLGDSSSPTEPS